MQRGLIIHNEDMAERCKVRFRWAYRGVLIELSDWCDKHESIGKYQYQYTDTVFWFEKEADAIWFKLTWANVTEDNGRITSH